MMCDRDMCYQNLWNDVPCEDCPCYEEERDEEGELNEQFSIRR